MQDTAIHDSGPAAKAINEDGFIVHGMTFTNKELIQIALYLSDTLSTDILEHEDINAVMFTLSTHGGYILCTPCEYNSEFTRIVDRNGNTANMVQYCSGFPDVNSFIRSDDSKITFVLSKGYLIDNFELRPGFFDFSMDGEVSSILIEAHDIESVSVKNPTIGR